MSENPRSLRQGKFKKLLVPADELPLEAKRLVEPFAALAPLSATDPALYGALWCLTYLRTRHPHGWWGAHRRDRLTSIDWPVELAQLPSFSWSEDERRMLERYPTLGELLNHRAFRATPEPVHRALLHWHAGSYPLVLMDRIPSVAEVLAQQIDGRRCVTLFHQEKQLGKLILGERDPLSFAYHDLIHADHFFHHNSMRQGQVGFYRQIHKLHSDGVLDHWLKFENFPGQLEYLMADMNAHPLHLWKCFKAILHMSDAPATLELFSNKLTTALGVDEGFRESLCALNSPTFVLQEHGVTLTKLAEAWGAKD
ncbi:MAG: hypothetical protein ACLGG7_02910 [Bacteriovoracia bacterium]